MNDQPSRQNAVDHLTEAEQLIQRVRHGVSDAPRRDLQHAKRLVDQAECDLELWRRSQN